MMKKQLVLIAFIMAGAVVLAQEKGRGHRQNTTEEMKKELSLNDSQYDRIKEIDESYRARFHALRIDSTRAKEDRVQSMRSLGDARRKEIEGVLTEDQKTKWDARQTARRDAHRAHSQRVAADHADKVKKELSLSDAQFRKFQQANEDFRNQMSKLKAKQLSDDKRKAEFRKLRAEHDKSMKKLLSKEQYKQWTEMKKTKRNHRDHHMRDRDHRS